MTLLIESQYQQIGQERLIWLENRKLLAAEISVDYTNLLKILKEHPTRIDSIKNILREVDGELIDWTWNLERFVYPVKTLNSKKN